MPEPVFRETDVASFFQNGVPKGCGLAKSSLMSIHRNSIQIEGHIVATSGVLTRIIAEAVGRPEDSVGVYIRKLREAGLFTTGARGVNAPATTPLDAARTLIAILGSEQSTRAAEIAQDFGRLKLSHSRIQSDFSDLEPNIDRYHFNELFGLEDRHDLEKAVASIVQAFASGDGDPQFRQTIIVGNEFGALDLRPKVRISLHRSICKAEITAWGHIYTYSLRAEAYVSTLKGKDKRIAAREYMETRAKYASPIQINAEVGVDVVATISSAFRDGGRNG